MPGGGRHPLAKSNITNIPSQHFRTTREMLDDFSFLPNELSYEIVVENTNKVLEKNKSIENEFNKACELFEKVFECSAMSCGSAGWQVANDYFRLQDKFKFLYASDTRGYAPFYPRFNGEVFKTLQIPTTLFTLDELLVSNKLSDISNIQVSSIKNADVSVMTIHAELEGMAYLQWFEEFLLLLKRENIEFFGLKDFAISLQNTKNNIPTITPKSYATCI